MAKRLVPATHFPPPTPEPAPAPAATEVIEAAAAETAVEAVSDVAAPETAAEVEETAPPEAQAAPTAGPAIVEVEVDERNVAAEPVVVHDAEANAPLIQTRQNHPGATVLKFGLPMKASTGYAPQSIVLTLSPKLARTLANFGEGLRAMGVPISHPQDAIKRLLEAMHEGGPNRLFFAEAGE